MVTITLLEATEPWDVEAVGAANAERAYRLADNSRG